MKFFSERNPVIIGALGMLTTSVVIVAAFNYDNVPLINRKAEFSAYFTEAGGLVAGAPVHISGLRVGQVSSVALEGSQVLVEFDVNEDVQLGNRSEAAVKTKSLLGAKILEITPRGADSLAGPIPSERTRPAYQLPDALGDLTETISRLDTDEMSRSLDVLADTFANTPASVRMAVQGVARFSKTLNDRDNHIRNLLANARKASTVLAERGEQIAGLVTDANALLVELRTESDALDQLAGGISLVAQQIKGFISENRETLKPALDKLNGVLAIVESRKAEVQKVIKGLNAYGLSLGESVSSGPFFKAYLSNLLPGQFVQPFIDSAFSDLGLDPNVKLPSELVDPQFGQPGTPAMPSPYPRTGQGGEPRLTIPDAITGKPDDPRYPYREPLPAPPPGGPPPGPAAVIEEHAGTPSAAEAHTGVHAPAQVAAAREAEQAEEVER